MASPGAGRAGARRDEWGRGATLRRLSGALAAPHPGLWALTLALIAADGVWLAWLGITLDPLGPFVVAAVVLVLLAVALLFSHGKSEPPLRAMALSTACLIAFTTAIAVLHYLTATLARPLIDAPLARAEAAMGFDWRAHLAAMRDHPNLAWALALAYHSSGPQVALVVVVLAAGRRLGRLWAFVRLFALTLVVVIAASALFPAEGPYAFYGERGIAPEGLETIGALWHQEPLAQLRGGTLTHLALGDIRGLATFPSFHVCLAILTAWALAPVPVIGRLALALNAAVVAATLSAGGHYLPDLLAGGLLALVVVVRQSLAGRLFRRGGRRALAAPPPAAAASHP